MIHKLRSKIKSVLAPILLHLAAAINSPGFAARVLAWVSWRVGKGECVVLCLGRSVFIDDVKAMVQYSGRIEYAVVHLKHFDAVLNHFVRGSARKEINEQNYYTSDIGLAGRRQYQDFLKKLLPLLARRLGYKAILSGNMSYVIQQEIIKASEELGIPFIVLHKEAMDVYGGILDYYRDYKFFGSKVLFYNQKIREEAVKRVAGLSADNTAVVGIPRFDAYFEKLKPAKAKHIVFFSFFPRDKFLAHIKNEQKPAEAKDAYAAFHKLIIDFASRHPDFRVTIKTKNAQHYLDYVLDIYRNHIAHPPPNIEITNSAKTADLIVDSEAVIGFDSTVLIEAVAARRAIICPDFRGFASDRSWDFFAGFEDLVRYVKTLEDLEKHLLGASGPAPDPQIREKFLTDLIGDTTGQASARAEAAIIETINNLG